ncbi:putative uncharacterized transposon-derived protein F54H12.3 [Nosema granulosis]|uniref:Uncharacterized transposon-derived protein F54H12.3 n=1 Tax=Nosema granulosis TaxID=83296 RepID=A0A9P6KZZ6_9MICR|nr:putative uncharacterized transposon-derived protein F54H12.3 [Nosema granulosis]
MVGLLPRSINNFLYLLTTVDHFTKVADLKVLRTKDSLEGSNALRETMRRRGCPEIIILDNGLEFANHRIRELATDRKIDWSFGEPSYTQTTTGLVDRFNRRFIVKLKRLSEYGKKDWVDCIEPALNGYLNTRHKAIGCTPLKMMRKSFSREQQEYIRKFQNSYKSKKQLY